MGLKFGALVPDPLHASPNFFSNLCFPHAAQRVRKDGTSACLDFDPLNKCASVIRKKILEGAGDQYSKMRMTADVPHGMKNAEPAFLRILPGQIGEFGKSPAVLVQ
ncbi:hypothetical protein DBR42_27065 [Pelomonas sp. HMWF004]|nr:hypothetical protein DBR42_27065 [Pelomonas sp. HMWF004]